VAAKSRGSKTDADSFAVIVALLLILCAAVAPKLGFDLGAPPASASGTGDLLEGARISPSTARDRLAVMVAAPEGSMAGYSRAEFPHWRKAASNGWTGAASACDTREAALLRDGVDVVVDEECRATSGTWVDPYTGATLASASQLEIDHVVPLAAAWRSGASGWTKEQRQAFANDPYVVLSVESGANSSKGDRGPEAWTPTAPGSACGYAVRWVDVKASYSLSVTEAERAKLNEMLGTCPAA